MKLNFLFLKKVGKKYKTNPWYYFQNMLVPWHEIWTFSDKKYLKKEIIQKFQ
jgi:hypothetical protein